MNGILNFSYASISQLQQSCIYGGVDSSGGDATISTDPGTDTLTIVTEYEEDNDVLFSSEGPEDEEVNEIYFSLSDIAAL